jgi:hypothetical protein
MAQTVPARYIEILPSRQLINLDNIIKVDFLGNDVARITTSQGLVFDVSEAALRAAIAAIPP